MATFELLAVSYFAATSVVAFFAAVRWPRRLAVAVGALLVAALVVTVAGAGSEPVRAWAPHLYLVCGYYLPALLVPELADATRFERWLVDSDRRLRPALPALPHALVDVTEFAYLVCYPLVPASFVVLWNAGTAGDVSRFWVAVLGAGYACYVSLPWLLSRPPRLLNGRPEPPRHLRRLNVFVLGRVSHQLNTFPSGHVAVSVAAALVVGTVAPIAGILVGIIATAIAVGAVAGRYHFVIDVVLGIVVGAGSALLALQV